LRINKRSRRLGLAPHAAADLVAELIMNADPGAILAPGAKGLISRLPMRQIMWH
jgi:hypothetical protein